ncbi:MAG: gamma-glutamylcyclotransferase family protein [Chloroflexota bacterium]
MAHIIFAHGSLMHLKQMRKTCPDAVPLGYGRLDGYRLAFTHYSKQWGGGVADIVPFGGMVVYGRVYHIGDNCKIALDMRRGNGIACIRIPVTVTLPESERTMRANTYKVIHPQPTEFAPVENYLHAITSGAREANLPPDYCEFLYGLWRAREKTSFRRGLMRVLRSVQDGICVNPADAPVSRPPAVKVGYGRFAARASLSVSRDQPKGTCSVGPSVLAGLHLPAHECYGSNLLIEP